MRYQARRSAAPALSTASDNAPDALEITDLGDRPVVDRLDVPAGSLPPSRGRRPAPIVVVVGALALIALAIGGPDLTSPGPAGNPGVVSSDGPTPTADRCPPEGLAAPTVDFGPPRNTEPGWWASPEQAGFPPPVDEFVGAGGGDNMTLEIEPAGCVVDVRIDVQATSVDRGLGLRTTTRQLVDRRRWAFDAPPAGDWTVRVGVLLRGASAAAGPWAVYFIRLQVDGAPFGEPYPSGYGPQPSSDVLVLPVRPCGYPVDGGALPPEIVLNMGSDIALPGTLGPSTWGGTESLGVDPGAVETIALPLMPMVLTIAEARCAVNWTISAGPTPSPGTAFNPGEFPLDSMRDNPTGDPAIAAQNEFSLGTVPLGPFVLAADLEFAGGDRATYYWRLDIPAPDPQGTVRARAGGPSVALVVGCGLWLAIGSGFEGGLNATAPCWEYGSESWPSLVGTPTLELAAGDLLHLELPGYRIVGWRLDYDVLGGEASRRVVGGGYFDNAVDAIDVPAPPTGDWIVRISLEVGDDDDRIDFPTYFLLDVAG